MSDFTTKLNQINQAQYLASTYNAISVNNDGSETPTWSGGINFFNRTAWQGAHLKGRAGNGTLESVLDTVLTPTFGWAGYRPNNLASTYDQDRRKYIAAITQYESSGNTSALTAVGLPVPTNESEKSQLLQVKEGFVNLERQAGQDAGGRNLSVEQYAKNQGKYLNELKSLQNQTVEQNGVVDAQKLQLVQYAKQEEAKLGGADLGASLQSKVKQLKQQFPNDPELHTALDHTMDTFNKELQNNGGTGIAGQGNQPLAYSRAVTGLMKELDQRLHAKSKGTRSQNVLDATFKGTDHQDVANLIVAVQTLSGGKNLSSEHIQQKIQNRAITEGFAVPNLAANEIYKLASGSQASGTNKRQKVIKDFGNGQQLVLNPDGNTYVLSTSYDKETGVRTTTSRLYNHGVDSLKALKKSIEKAKSIDEKKLANTGTVYVQRQGDNNTTTQKGGLYALKADFSSKEAKAKTEALRNKAVSTAKAETTLEQPQQIQPKAPPTRQATNNNASSPTSTSNPSASNTGNQTASAQKLQEARAELAKATDPRQKAHWQQTVSNLEAQLKAT